MTTREDLSQPLDESEYRELNSVLIGLEHDQAVLNMSELDGLITAIASAPEHIAPSAWLPLVWGDAEHAPALEGPQEFERLVTLIMRHLNTTVATLVEDPERFEPFFMENVVDGRAYLVVDDWCIGYMKGVDLWGERWLSGEPDPVELLSPIHVFASKEGWDLLEQLADRHVEYLQNQVAPTARAAFRHWRSGHENVAATPPEGASIH